MTDETIEWKGKKWKVINPYEINMTDLPIHKIMIIEKLPDQEPEKLVKFKEPQEIWKHMRRLFLCKCGMCFGKHDELTDHIKEHRRWSSRHYAPDYTEIRFRINLWKRRVKNG